MISTTFFSNLIDNYTVYYPIIMAFIWILGAILSKIELNKSNKLKLNEKVSVVVSVFNEEETIEDLLSSLFSLNYPNIEIIIVDDCSTDSTLKKIYSLENKYEKWSQLKVIEKSKNEGKATALNIALKSLTGDYMLVLDADAYLNQDAVGILLANLKLSEKNGAITGRPIVRNRSTLLGKIQTLEYLCIIDSIKRTQNFFGAIMTVSGVIVMYRVEALLEVGGFDTEVMTEDIDVTWRLYRNGWNVLYNPNALCYILTPEKNYSLFRQRNRWAIGGLEVLKKNFFWTLTNGKLHHKFLMIEMFCSQLWSWAFLLSSFKYLVLIQLSNSIRIPGSIIIIYIILTYVIYFIGISNDKNKSCLTNSDKIVLPVYLLLYWFINFICNIVALFRILTGNTTKGKWNSPDRGV